MSYETEDNGWRHGVWDPSYIETCDKVDLFFCMPVNEFTDQYARVYEFFEVVSATYEDCPISAHLHALGADDNGNRMYMVETWGKFAHMVLRELPHEWYTFIARVDWRISVDVNVNRLKFLYAYIEANQKRARNLQLFDTRPRTKKQGRNAGGKGLAVGSHKSEARLSVYQKTGERGAIELQVKGAKLQQCITDAKRLHAVPGSTWPLWGCLMIVLQSRAEEFAMECGFPDMEPLVRAVLEPDETDDVEASFYHAVRELRTKLERMNQQERVEVVRDLGLTLNDFSRASQLRELPASPPVA